MGCVMILRCSCPHGFHPSEGLGQLVQLSYPRDWSDRRKQQQVGNSRKIKQTNSQIQNNKINILRVFETDCLFQLHALLSMGLQWDPCSFLESGWRRGCCGCKPVTSEHSRTDSVWLLELGHEKDPASAWLSAYLPLEPNRWAARQPRPHAKAWQSRILCSGRQHSSSQALSWPQHGW